MRTLLIGIDSGTQSTKAVVVDAKNGRVLGMASVGYDLIPGYRLGRKSNTRTRGAMRLRRRLRQLLRQLRPGRPK
ncbi:MAG: hypothetical protein NZ739_01190 [Verrucomicrobiae bacterium]|nr:hypothetical protein [Verrucomicrobiae bacterium]